MSKPPFEWIVNRHGPAVLRVCRVVLGPIDADDAWSETFLAALRAYPQLDERVNLEAWLVTVAHRKAIDIVRTRGRQAIPMHDPPDSPSRLGLPAEPADELWAAVQSLPDKQRHAVAYHHVAGLPHQQVAEILGGSVDSARRAAADGIRTLRRIYARDPESKGATRS